ncbi:uncharacterized protein LOC117314791 [Pecten maximus]|uniref:uncharacterized protein LOC117314791 n=1 Tax=Pecten maximus TaxID=6579 RepID=UPI001458C8A0|nr:uncharacterized protein LOC117314791 [Pecten maximus]
MADRPNQGSPDSSNYEQIAFAVIMVIVAVIVQIMSFMHLWIRPTEQTVTAQGNTKGSRVTIGKSSYVSKLKKRMHRPRPINVEINSATIGNENITVLGSASPPLIEGRNKDPTRIMQNTVSMWEKQAGDIFVTNGLENVRDASMKKNLLIITGPQGSGKSTALRYASVTLKENGYIVYPCTKPSEIVYYWDDTKKQVFVIDDPVGRECVSLISVHKLEKHKESIKHCIEGHTTKVILAVRSEIINDKFVSSSKTLLTWRQNEVDLTDDEHTLSEQERKDMLWHYLSRNGVHGKFSLQMPNLHCFPLLCHAFCKVEPIRRKPSGILFLAI